MMPGAAFAIAGEIASRVVVAALKAIAGSGLAIGNSSGARKEDRSGE
jgi:hypothetical protein